MTKANTAISVFFTIMLTCPAVQPVTVNVSPSGSDALGDGSAAKPYATLTKARDELRRLGSKGGLSAGATVLLADGEYRLSRPLELDSRDSGNSRFPIRWKAANRGKAVITGAGGLAWRKIPAEDPIHALLPEAARAHVLCAEIPGDSPLPGFRNVGCFTFPKQRKLVETALSFYQGGNRLECARWPNDGWTKMGKQHGATTSKPNVSKPVHKEGLFEFDDRDRLSRWTKEPDLWAHGLWYYQWADSYERVLGVDAEKGLMHVENVLEEWGFKEGNEFYVLNAFTELDRPGEWAVDRARRRAYAWPLQGMQSQMDFASATNLVFARDLQNVVFDGLVLELAYKDAAVFRNASNVVIEASIVRHAGGWAVRFEGGGTCRVDGCDMYDIGEGGVYLEGGDLGNLVPAGHKAVNCHIHHYGRVVPNYRPAVSLNGVGCRAERNLVHHSDHLGLLFKGNDHYIGYNVLHDLCQHNDDAGSIYGYMCDFTQRGTVIEYNIVHMTGNQPRAHHVNALYLDAWTSGVTLRGNILNRAPQGVWSSGGQENKIVKNLIMNCVVPVARGNNGRGGWLGKGVWTKGHKSHMMQKLLKNRARYGQPPWRDKYPKMLAPLDFEDGQFAHCALWNTISNNVAIGCGKAICYSWKETKDYTAIGDNLTFEGDPFVDYYNFDWRLKPDSPLREFLGADYRFTEAGLFQSPTRVSPPVRFSPDATRPRPLTGEFADPVARIDLTFDGALPAGETGMAEDLENCRLPSWGNGKRIVTGFGNASTNSWKEYSFSFTPKCDGIVSVLLMGGQGEMTLYDDIRAEGIKIVDGDFSSGRKSWHFTRTAEKDSPFFGGVTRRHGIFERLPAAPGLPEFQPSTGTGFASANHDLRVIQNRVAIRKGVRVKLTFKARAYMP